MVDLYMSSKSIVSEHIKHIFDEGELDKKEVVRKFRTTAGDGKNHSVTYYNFDMIIALGYRIKSVVATRFRRWDNHVLKDYLVKGYAVNERIHKEQIGELWQLVGMLGRTIQNQPLLSTDETNALFNVVTDYTYAFDTLDSYDYQRLTVSDTTSEATFHATYDNAMQAILSLKERFRESQQKG